jgi:hypothetical protein
MLRIPIGQDHIARRERRLDRCPIKKLLRPREQIRIANTKVAIVIRSLKVRWVFAAGRPRGMA